jgi:cell division septation protein DedD
MVGRGVPTRPALELAEQADLDPTAAIQGVPAVPAVAGTAQSSITAQETLSYPSLLKERNPSEETLRPPGEFSADSAAETVSARPMVADGPPAAGKPSSAIVLPPPGVKPPAATPVPGPAVKPAASSAAPITTNPSPPKPTAAVSPAATPPSPPPAASVPVSTSPAGLSTSEPTGSGFVVQVAATRARSEADAIVRRLAAKGYPAFVTTSGQNFRVRVGKYGDRSEAESIAGRLEREEQFKPWITR